MAAKRKVRKQARASTARRPKARKARASSKVKRARKLPARSPKRKATKTTRKVTDCITRFFGLD